MTVLVIGEALLDVTRDETSTRSVPGGSPANVALGLARLGRETVLHTSIGDDEAGRAIRAHLEASGVRLTGTSISERRTSSATAELSAGGDARYEFDISWQPAPPRTEGFEIVHTGSIGAWLAPGAEVVARALEAARASGSLVTFDPNVRPTLIDDAAAVRDAISARIATADVVKLSDEDAAWIYPGFDDDDVLDAVLAAGARVAAITKGGEGAVIASQEHRIARPSAPVAVADTIGAGDTFMTILVDALVEDSALLEGDRDHLKRTLDRALRAASITVSRAGADLPWGRDLT